MDPDNKPRLAARGLNIKKPRKVNYIKRSRRWEGGRSFEAPKIPKQDRDVKRTQRKRVKNASKDDGQSGCEREAGKMGEVEGGGRGAGRMKEKCD